jgi:membrane associated rhomboid family serine protease
MTEFRPTRFQILPPVVKNILIINVLVVLLQLVLGSRGIDISDYFGLHYWKSDLFRPWQLITHMFLHGSADPAMFQTTLLHIFSNMFALWMFGSILENIWGPQRFLIFYFVCGLGAALLHLLVVGYDYNLLAHAFIRYTQDPSLDQYIYFINQQDVGHIQGFATLRAFWESNPMCSNCPVESVSLIQQYYNLKINEATVGASGAVFGVLFAFGYLFPNTLIYLYFFVPVKAKYFVAFYALFELYAGIRNSAGDNVAHFAHLGGMLFAFILLRIWKRNVRDRFY